MVKSLWLRGHFRRPPISFSISAATRSSRRPSSRTFGTPAFRRTWRSPISMPTRPSDRWPHYLETHAPRRASRRTTNRLAPFIPTGDAWFCGIGQMACLYLFLLFAAVPTAIRLSGGHGLGFELCSWPRCLSVRSPLRCCFFCFAGVRKVDSDRPLPAGHLPAMGLVLPAFWLVRRLLAPSPLDTAGRLSAVRFMPACWGANRQGMSSCHRPDRSPGLDRHRRRRPKSVMARRFSPSSLKAANFTLGRISIGRDAFIGANVLVLPGHDPRRSRPRHRSIARRTQANRFPPGQTWSGRPPAEFPTAAGLDAIGFRAARHLDHGRPVTLVRIYSSACFSSNCCRR